MLSITSMKSMSARRSRPPALHCGWRATGLRRRISKAWKNLLGIFPALEKIPREFPIFGKCGGAAFQSLETGSDAGEFAEVFERDLEVLGRRSFELHRRAGGGVGEFQRERVERGTRDQRTFALAWFLEAALQ